MFQEKAQQQYVTCAHSGGLQHEQKEMRGLMQGSVLNDTSVGLAKASAGGGACRSEVLSQYQGVGISTLGWAAQPTFQLGEQPILQPSSERALRRFKSKQTPPDPPHQAPAARWLAAAGLVKILGSHFPPKKRLRQDG